MICGSRLCCQKWFGWCYGSAEQNKKKKEYFNATSSPLTMSNAIHSNFLNSVEKCLTSEIKCFSHFVLIPFCFLPPLHFDSVHLRFFVLLRVCWLVAQSKSTVNRIIIFIVFIFWLPYSTLVDGMPRYYNFSREFTDERKKSRLNNFVFGVRENSFPFGFSYNCDMNRQFHT